MLHKAYLIDIPETDAPMAKSQTKPQILDNERTHFVTLLQFYIVHFPIAKKDITKDLRIQILTVKCEDLCRTLVNIMIASY